MTSTEIKALLNRHKSLKYDESKSKVICELTKHEMPLTVSAIESYVKGKKYQKAVEKAYDFNQYKPHIVPSTKRNHLHKLFCVLTLRHVAWSREAVERHVLGKKYKRAFARWTRCQETGEKFVPRGGKHKKAGDSDSDSIGSSAARNWSDDSSGDDSTEADDLEDLYPAEVFGKYGEEDDDSEDSEDEESEVKENPSSFFIAQKRPTDEPHGDGDKSDYDMDILNRVEDGTRDDGSLKQKTADKPKKKGEKRKKSITRANGDAAVQSLPQSKKAKSKIKNKREKQIQKT
ncbi:surfeit locus protein 2 [Elysia marginata]|uniref:Surfeit locus protein 2 n=1 Tax=Elysia marginata TaxID=1093978 RepID=A0AAV4JW01_9GAST|nr:surfeit locus protein 2 [Elysia marginata]